MKQKRVLKLRESDELYLQYSIMNIKSFIYILGTKIFISKEIELNLKKVFYSYLNYECLVFNLF
jgi:hypothetical protein